MRTIIHISADYPDPVVPNKTQAIKNLISATHGYRHVVYSLNRVSRALGIDVVRFGENATSIMYAAPPKGILLEYCLNMVADWIRKDLLQRNIKPDLLHAHKLTIEGIVACRLSDEFEVPFFTSIQGDTDLKVAKHKPSLHQLYSRIWHESQTVFPFSVWSRNYFEGLFGTRELPTQLLPCLTPQDRLFVSKPAVHKSIVTIFHLDNWKRKNATRMIEAVINAVEQVPDLVLDIYGSGSPSSYRGLANYIRKKRGADIVRLKGAIPHDQVQATINKYSMLALPSLRESFGMAASEGLMSGVPVLISRNWGIDGIFPEHEIGAVCNPYSIEDMTEKILFILDNEVDLKTIIGRNQMSGHLDLLGTSSIVGTYLQALANVVALPAVIPSAASRPESRLRV
ncbi:MAG: glycosyltransferase [Rhizobiaceae bacterium]